MSVRSNDYTAKHTEQLEWYRDLSRALQRVQLRISLQLVQPDVPDQMTTEPVPVPPAATREVAGELRNKALLRG